MNNEPERIYLWHPESECLWYTYGRKDANETLDLDGCVQELSYEEYLKIKREHDI